MVGPYARGDHSIDKQSGIAVSNAFYIYPCVVDWKRSSYASAYLIGSVVEYHTTLHHFVQAQLALDFVSAVPECVYVSERYTPTPSSLFQFRSRPTQLLSTNQSLCALHCIFRMQMRGMDAVSTGS